MLVNSSSFIQRECTQVLGVFFLSPSLEGDLWSVWHLCHILALNLCAIFFDAIVDDFDECAETILEEIAVCFVFFAVLWMT